MLNKCIYLNIFMWIAVRRMLAAVWRPTVQTFNRLFSKLDTARCAHAWSCDVSTECLSNRDVKSPETLWINFVDADPSCFVVELNDVRRNEPGLELWAAAEARKVTFKARSDTGGEVYLSLYNSTVTDRGQQWHGATVLATESGLTAPSTVH